MKLVKLVGGPGDGEEVQDSGHALAWLPGGVGREHYEDHTYTRQNAGEPFIYDPGMKVMRERIRKETWG